MGIRRAQHGKTPLRVASLFCGAGGLDLGFKQAGFKVVWANDNDSAIEKTFYSNFPETLLDTRDVTTIPASHIPDVDGFIGGPPCQSFSIAGNREGIRDKRGQLFFEYIGLLEKKQPSFFLIENVSGILHTIHHEAYTAIIAKLEQANYFVTHQVVDAYDYSVPQNRKRVFIIGFHKEKVGCPFVFPKPTRKRLCLKDALNGLPKAVPARTRRFPNRASPRFPNHEYMEGNFSSHYRSRNRVRPWDKPSFTIPASGAHAPLHPQAPVLSLNGNQGWVPQPGKKHLLRRMTVRECARIQTFPDDFGFTYTSVAHGYRMVGNAVPVRLAYVFAKQILKALNSG